MLGLLHGTLHDTVLVVIAFINVPLCVMCVIHVVSIGTDLGMGLGITAGLSVGKS